MVENLKIVPKNKKNNIITIILLVICLNPVIAWIAVFSDIYNTHNYIWTFIVLSILVSITYLSSLNFILKEIKADQDVRNIAKLTKWINVGHLILLPIGLILIMSMLPWQTGSM